MNENRRKILDMLSAGQITADEAERLIAAIEKEPADNGAANDASTPKARPKYIRVLVEDTGHGANPRVNVRVPMRLLRAGVKLAHLIPSQARVHVNDALHEKGVHIDLGQIKPENLEELVEQLNDLTVDVDQKDANTKVKVRVFCE